MAFRAPVVCAISLLRSSQSSMEALIVHAEEHTHQTIHLTTTLWWRHPHCKNAKRFAPVAGMQGHRVEFPHSLWNLDACSRHRSRPVCSRSLMHELYPNAKCADLVSMRFIEHSFVSFQCSSCIFATRKFSRVRRFLARAFRVCPAESHLCCRTASLQEWTGNSTCNRLQQLQKRQCGRRLARHIWQNFHRIFPWFSMPRQPQLQAPSSST